MPADSALSLWPSTIPCPARSFPIFEPRYPGKLRNCSCEAGFYIPPVVLLFLNLAVLLKSGNYGCGTPPPFLSLATSTPTPPGVPTCEGVGEVKHVEHRQPRFEFLPGNQLPDHRPFALTHVSPRRAPSDLVGAHWIHIGPNCSGA